MIVAFLLCLFCTTINASGLRFGLGGGISFTFGSPLNRLGFSIGTYEAYENYQLNSSFRLYHVFSSLGPGLKTNEVQISLGATAGFGSGDTKENLFISSVSNQTERKYSLGYSYNIYLDGMHTSQQTGTIGIEVNRLLIITENDFLAGGGGDKFRTGAQLIGYRLDKTQLSITSVLWTGNSASGLARRIYDSTYPARYGYKDLRDATYGSFSNGILSLQLMQALPYSQIAQVNAGFDSEKIRHAFQNRLIHDVFFLPKSWIKHGNPHLPMLDKKGEPYLYKADQKIKPAKGVFQLSLNPALFY